MAEMQCTGPMWVMQCQQSLAATANLVAIHGGHVQGAWEVCELSAPGHAALQLAHLAVVRRQQGRALHIAPTHQQLQGPAAQHTK